jgi:hypothetical protein
MFSTCGTMIMDEFGGRQQSERLSRNPERQQHCIIVNRAKIRALAGLVGTNERWIMEMQDTLDELEASVMRCEKRQA